MFSHHKDATITKSNTAKAHTVVLQFCD